MRSASQVAQTVRGVSGNCPAASAACARKSSATEFIANDTVTAAAMASTLMTNRRVPSLSIESDSVRRATIGLAE